VSERVPAAREEELLRINAELAAEIRRLAAGEIRGPRSGAVPSARGLTRLTAELREVIESRAELSAEQDRLQVELDQRQRRIGGLEERVAACEAEQAQLAHEVQRLRGGPAGFARRVWARLLRRR
jgi:chromosome segregation ATPase